METYNIHGASVKGAVVSSHERKPGPRGLVGGWTNRSRNTIWSYTQRMEPDAIGQAIEQERLYAGTLTYRDYPPTPEEMHHHLKMWLQWCLRHGMEWAIWLIEWQLVNLEREGRDVNVPHVHTLSCFENSDEARRLTWHEPDRQEWPGPIYSAYMVKWLELTAKYRTLPVAQDLTPIRHIEHYTAYMVNHCGRGKDHPQRNPEKLPASWHGKTGRVVGKTAATPLRPVVRLESSDRDGFYRIRRAARRLAEARAAGYIDQAKARAVQFVADAYDLDDADLLAALKGHANPAAQRAASAHIQSHAAVQSARKMNRVRKVRKTRSGAKYCPWPRQGRQVSSYLGFTATASTLDSDLVLNLLKLLDMPDKPLKERYEVA